MPEPLELELLRWATVALAQPADSQIALFPSFVPVGDELALHLEEALDALKRREIVLAPQRAAKLEKLDKLVLAMSELEHVAFWEDNDVLHESPRWAEIWVAAAELAAAFDWPLAAPPPSSRIYITSAGKA